MEAMSLPGPRKHALITGAGNGLGRSLALNLGARGWHIGIADLEPADAAETRRLVEQAGGTAEFLPLDVRDEAGWADLRSELERRWRRLDLLANNAGVSCSGEVGQSSMETGTGCSRSTCGGSFWAATRWWTG